MLGACQDILDPKSELRFGFALIAGDQSRFATSVYFPLVPQSQKVVGIHTEQDW
jgi:hypothetical protein